MIGIDGLLLESDVITSARTLVLGLYISTGTPRTCREGVGNPVTPLPYDMEYGRFSIATTIR